MRFCTLSYCRMICRLLWCVLSGGCLLAAWTATSLFASPPVQTETLNKPKKQIRIARKLEFPFDLATPSPLVAASLKSLQAQPSTGSSRAAVSSKTLKSRTRAKSPNTRNRSSQGVYHYLAQKRLTVEYRDMPFDEVINELRNQLDINMIVYWPQIQSGPIERDAPVTLALKNVSAYTALNAVMNYVSGGSFEKLDFVVNRGVLEIGLKGRLTERRTVRVYYVGDLMAPRSDYYNSVMGIGLGSQFGGGQSGGGRFGSDSNRQNRNSSRFGSDSSGRRFGSSDRFR